MSKNELKKNLYGWVVTHNYMTGNYRACHHEDVSRLFSVPETTFLSSSSYKTLEELIIINKGDRKRIQHLIDNK